MSGFSLEAMRIALDAVLPNGTNRYVALFTTAPSDDGEGGIEPAGGWYARVTVSAWLIQQIGGTVLRKVNAGNVAFPTNSSGASVVVVAVGIYDAATEGVLLGWQPTRSVADVETPITIPDTDTPTISLELLRLALGPEETEQLSSLCVTTEDSVQTTNATPAVLRIAASLDDGKAYHIKAEVVAVDAGGTKHYWRTIHTSYFRDDGASGSVTWSVRELTTDGVDTRTAPGGFTLATARLLLTGDRVDLEVTGEAGTTVNWESKVTVTKES